MSALPMHPTERDRERFRDITKAMGIALEYDRNDRLGSYRDAITEMAWKIWWAQERERQLLQNLNMSQGVKISELLERAEKAESELEAERKRLDWAMKKQAYYGRSPDRLWVDVGAGNHKWFAVYDDNPRTTIDELIAGEPK